MKTIIDIILIAMMFLFVACDKNSDQTGSVPSRPILTTSTISQITESSAASGGTISSDGGANIIARGVCWNTSPFPTLADNKTNNGTGIGDFTSSLTGLIQDTKYYIRAYATNSNGTTYGNEIEFRTLKGEQTVIDVDGNTYHTIKIGNQIWMVENLKTTKYRNGDIIESPTDGWITTYTGAQCCYNNDYYYSSIYGRLYNWYATIDSRNIAPTGWHVPSDNEWNMLITYLGGYSVAQNKMKEIGTTHWLTYNSNITNESGFTALPCGYRDFGSIGIFSSLGSYTSWWSTTSSTTNTGRAWCFDIHSDNTIERGTYGKAAGFSIRCLKDY